MEQKNLTTNAETVSDLLRVTAQALLRERNRYWAMYDLTSTQIDVMYALLNKSVREDDPAPTTQAWLQNKLHLSNATISGIITRLETKGLVERRPMEGNARKNDIRLTQAALDLDVRGMHTKRLLEEHLLEDFSEREIQQTITNLKRIYRNIQHMRDNDDEYLK